jgi:glycine cleavage system H protein
MTVLLIVIMFAVILLIDHLTNRSDIPVLQPALVRTPRMPYIAPSIVGGFELKDNVRYHPGHTWALNESPELVRVGMDDFAARLTGHIDRMGLPNRGQWIRQGQKVFSIEKDGRKTEMVSPIEGTVIDVNERVMENPDLARKDPYGEGWLLKVNAPDSPTSFRNLLSGSVARRWTEDAALRLRSLFPTPAGVVLQDGGLAVPDLGNHLPDDVWEKASREFFLG